MKIKLPNEFPVLSNNRLHLSPIMDNDERAIFDIFSDEKVIKYYNIKKN